MFHIPNSASPPRWFSSARERRLWMWTLAIVAAIYLTLGLASSLAELLRAHGMNDDLAAVGFLTGMALIGATILTQGLKRRPGGVEIAVALGVTAVFFMVFLRVALTERSHLIEYSIVGAFIYEALAERVRQGRRVPVPALLAIIATSLVGALDEFIQAFLPSRVFDPVDILFNSFVGGMAVLASVALGWARRHVTNSTQKP